jgi:hypothetical protein
MVVTRRRSGRAPAYSVELPAEPFSLFAFAAGLFPIAFAGQGLLDPEFLPRLQVECVSLDLLDDVLLQHLPLEAPERVLQRLAFLKSYLCQIASPINTNCDLVIPISVPFSAAARGRLFRTPQSAGLDIEIACSRINRLVNHQRHISAVFGALADATRRRILVLLSSRGETAGGALSKASRISPMRGPRCCRTQANGSPSARRAGGD